MPPGPVKSVDRKAVQACGARSRPRRFGTAALGLALAAAGAGAALAPPIDELAHRSFAAHMVQHEIIAFVIPPFMLLFAAALPWSGPWTVAAIANALSRPVAALLISTAVLWAWHLPALYDAALRSDGVHLVEHATIFLAYLLFWRPLTGPGDAPVVLGSNGGRAAYLVAGAMQAAVLGATLTFADDRLYSYYVEASDPLLPAHLDQQLGGAIMWFSGPVVFGLAAAMVFRNRG